eukprot:scaffold1051_cov119-Cylindrotheca_fusiformis.AAC.11
MPMNNEWARWGDFQNQISGFVELLEPHRGAKSGNNEDVCGPLTLDASLSKFFQCDRRSRRRRGPDVSACLDTWIPTLLI